MLVESPRYSAKDLAHWKRLERYDAVLADDPRLDRAQGKACDEILKFSSKGPCYCGVSWGKDSVVIAHLVRICAPSIPLVWIRVENTFNPDCPMVRDSFLAKYPGIYHEVVVDYETNHAGKGFSVVEKQLGTKRYISGVRAEESGVRKKRMMTFGPSTSNTCAPIGWWTGEMIFAYLYKHNLPVHPAYAMTMNGALDRTRLRVSSLFSDKEKLGSHGYGRGRKEWEAWYYRDCLRQKIGLENQ
jgi:phosphoadenosine phosphosulfate reductase